MLNQEQQIYKQIEKANRILITFSKEADGDQIASALAWYLFFKKIGKNVELVGGRDADKKIWSFLPAWSEIKNHLENLRQFIVSLNIKNAKVAQIKYLVENEQLNFIISPSSGWFSADDVSARAGDFKYDLIITLGTPDLESLGDIYDQNVEFFYKTTIINIDYHPENEEYGQINLLELSYLAAAEISYDLFKNYPKFEIDEDLATCLLAGLIARTKNFKTTNLTPHILLTTSELFGLGARQEEIVDRLYRSRGLNALKLWGKILNNLSTEAGGHLLWSYLGADNMIPGHDPENDLADIIDELLINLPETKIAVLFYPGSEPNTSQALAYAGKNLNLKEVLKSYEPSGFARIIRIKINKDIKTAIIEINDLLKKALVKIT